MVIKHHVCEWRQSWWLTCGVALNDWQVIHLQSGITPTPRKLHYMVLPVIYKLWRLLDIYVVCSHVKHHSNVSALLRQKRKKKKTTSADEKRKTFAFGKWPNMVFNIFSEHSLGPCILNSGRHPHNSEHPSEVQYHRIPLGLPYQLKLQVAGNIDAYNTMLCAEQDRKQGSVFNCSFAINMLIPSVDV